MRRKYAALWSSEQSRSYIIFKDEGDPNWSVLTEVDNIPNAVMISDALNKQY